MGNTEFVGFGHDAVSWFEGLEQDNSKEYFTATRNQWETQIRDPLTALLHDLSLEFGGTVRVFRQNRDVRFSPDKSPYKLTTYGTLERSDAVAGLYAEISKLGLYAGTGYHELARDQLERFRAAVLDEASGAALADLLASLTAAGLEPLLMLAPLKTVPRGYPHDHARVALLRQKDLIMGKHMPPSAALASRAAREHVAWVWHTAAPLNAWLDQHVGASSIPPEVRYGRGQA
ncbi:MAG: DUF2461 domain-containing protein [Chloroflexaceae bacterium]|nr:DUF2461 domain-containing protein [Chloroflexaceae bacterium]